MTSDSVLTTGRVTYCVEAPPRSDSTALVDQERTRSRRYPISRWTVIPITRRVAARLAPTAVTPTQTTLMGLLFGIAATVLLFLVPSAGPAACLLVLGAWFMDRTDGLLARRQGTTSPFGAWLDANVDEFHDVAWHTASAYAAAALSGSQLPWFLLVGFLAGKYLFMNGLSEERALAVPGPEQSENQGTGFGGWIRAAYHLPGNADIRLHLLILGLATGFMTVELAIVAAYYNLRWMVRIGLVAHRLEGHR